MSVLIILLFVVFPSSLTTAAALSLPLSIGSIKPILSTSVTCDVGIPVDAEIPTTILLNASSISVSSLFLLTREFIAKLFTIVVL